MFCLVYFLLLAGLYCLLVCICYVIVVDLFLSDFGNCVVFVCLG